MSEMIERLAERIFNAVRERQESTERWAHFGEIPSKEDARAAASAALAGMRDPTESMLMAGSITDQTDAMLMVAWHAMIDEALR